MPAVPPAAGLPAELVRSIPNRDDLAHVLLPPRPFYVFSAAHFPARDPAPPVAHSHPCVCLHGCLTGPVALLTPEGERPLEPGEFVLMAPGVEHAWRNPGRHPATTVGLWLEPAGGDGPLVLNRLVRGVHPFRAAGDDELHSVFWHLADHLLADRPRHPLATTGLLLALSGLAAERLAARDGDRRPDADAARAIRRFLAARVGTPVRLDEVARRVGLSERQAERVFRAAYGTGVMAYFNRLRLDRAKRLLEGTGLTVEEVGRRVGYASPAHFGREFRRHAGEPPGRFRRRAASGAGGRA